MSTYLIVPCFNEGLRLRGDEFLRLIRLREELEILFVNDGSSDNTKDVLSALESASDRISAIHLGRNAGKAEAIRVGMLTALSADAQIVGYADADLATPVEELERMLVRMDQGPQAVLLGARVRLLGTSIERHPSRHYLGRVFAAVASLGLGIPVYDTQCGAKFFRQSSALVSALQEPFRSRWVFDVELLARLLAGEEGQRLDISDFEEFPLRSWRDVGGSKLRFAAMIRAGLQLLFFLLFLRLPWLRNHALARSSSRTVRGGDLS